MYAMSVTTPRAQLCFEPGFSRDTCTRSGRTEMPTGIPSGPVTP